jgi:protein-tyrosine phosphatase
MELPKIRVLFVCLGNICRSPRAKAVFRHKVLAAGLADRFEIDSAGTGDWHIGKPPHPGTRALLDARKISYESMTARQICSDTSHSVCLLTAVDCLPFPFSSRTSARAKNAAFFSSAG